MPEKSLEKTPIHAQNLESEMSEELLKLQTLHCF